MLGLRKILGCQIDLHQGDISRFVCDVVVNHLGDLAPGQETERLTAVYDEGLQHSLQKGARHMAFAPKTPRVHGRPVGSDAAAAMAAVRQFVKSRPAGLAVSRITFVLSDESEYEAFQQALFAAFPEDL